MDGSDFALEPTSSTNVLDETRNCARTGPDQIMVHDQSGKLINGRNKSTEFSYFEGAEDWRMSMARVRTSALAPWYDFYLAVYRVAFNDLTRQANKASVGDIYSTISGSPETLDGEKHLETD